MALSCDRVTRSIVEVDFLMGNRVSVCPRGTNKMTIGVVRQHQAPMVVLGTLNARALCNNIQHFVSVNHDNRTLGVNRDKLHSTPSWISR